MTLDEAIEYEETIADACKAQADMRDLDDPYARKVAYENDKCAKEHRQIAEYLKELRKLRKQDRALDKVRDEVEKLEVIEQIYSYEGHTWAMDMKEDVLEIIDKCRKDGE